MTMASAMPMIGTESGATIIAPMTVAVESAITPAVAITADSAQHASRRPSASASTSPGLGQGLRPGRPECVADCRAAASRGRSSS